MEIYVSRPGDSLGTAAKRLGVSPAELMEANRLRDPRRLVPGLALAVPGENTQRRNMEIGAVLGPTVPESVLDGLLPSLSFVCTDCRGIGAEGGLTPGETGRMREPADKAGVLRLMTVANLDGAGNYSAALAHSALAEAGGQQALLESILAALEEGGYGGVHLCLCHLHAFDRESYNSFLALAARTLHQRGYYLSTAVAPIEPGAEESIPAAAHDYAAHGRYADRVTILAYDWGYTLSAPQPVSPVDRVRAVLDYAAGKLPPGRTLLALSDQGYSWPLPWRIGDRARPISHTAAVNLAVAVGAEVKFDVLSRGSWFTYTDAAGQRRVVWFEDGRSVMARLHLAEEHGLAGVSLVSGSRGGAALRLIQSAWEPERLL